MIPLLIHLAWNGIPVCAASDASGPLCSIPLWPFKTTLFDRGWAGRS